MTVPTPDDPWSVVDKVGQSPPVDCTKPYNTSTLAGKTILITGGASGFGAAFARHWARHGAHIIIGDVNDAAGEALVAELRSSSSSASKPSTVTQPQQQHFAYQHCNVTSWAEQVSLFQTALAGSPTGSIDAVVAGAGVADPNSNFDRPRRLDPTTTAGGDHHPAAPPAQPPLNVLAVNLTGVMYTAHLALWYLARNPPGRDRHLLLVSSIAGVAPLPGQAEYTASKHGVMGLFRALRGTAYVTRSLRVNVLNPYFVDTPIITKGALALLAGAPMAELDDVVDAATRLVADEGIVGRALMIGPKMDVVDEEVDGEDVGVRLARRGEHGRRQAVWEIYGHDFERVETFVWRYLSLMNTVKAINGWIGFVKDIWGIYFGGRRR
ncbi:NAD(P)-binding protein [Canariomyces notabilis]|uniref:NAD(P)-binding protein n=1 Tax=Canariomyces notabilis TaxID=2074819 RepID=A0AAN6TNI1_9PEZI|nr:NAD(P)-binding protein [Canariomyces arenarius]